MELCEAQASLKAPAETSDLARDTTFQIFQISSSEKGYFFATDNHGIFAYLDSITSQALRKLDAIPNIITKAVVETAKLGQNTSRKTSSKPPWIISLSVNIYGPHRCADQVGQELSDISAFLQLPFFLEAGCEHFNPQCFRLGDAMSNMSHLAGLNERDLTRKAISDEVERVFESLGFTDQDTMENQPEPQPEAVITQLKE